MDLFDAVATIECQACQEANGVELPASPTDDSIARCRACGTDLGRWGDLSRLHAPTPFDAETLPKRHSICPSASELIYLIGMH